MFLSRLIVVFAQSIIARCWVKNEDVVGAAPTGYAPTTFEWSTILLPTKVRLILKIWVYYPGALLSKSTYNNLFEDRASTYFIFKWVPKTWLQGGRLNIKMSSHQYRDPHVKDKTASRPSYFLGNLIPGKDGLYIETAPRKQPRHCFPCDVCHCTHTT